MMKFRKRMSKEDGFTLIEVMIVVVILAILSGIAIFSFGGLQTQAKNAKVGADMRAIATALKGYYAETGAWPVQAPGALDTLTITALPYTALIDKIPDDPYAAAGAEYGYVNPDPSNNAAVDITSVGGTTMVVQ